MRRPLLAVALLAALGVGDGRSAAETRSEFPQAKINHVDVSQAPRIKLYVSVLDKRLRPPGEDWIEEITVQHKPERERPVDLFSLVDGEPVFPKAPDGSEREVPKEELPTMTLAADDEAGMAAVLVVPGYADPAYRDGALGEGMRNGAALFFKKLGKANLMNVVMYDERARVWVKAKGRTQELTPLTETIQETCDAWALQELERYGEPPGEPKEEGVFEDGEAYCGLTAEYGDLGKILKQTSYDGETANLFGLGAPRCVEAEAAGGPPRAAEDEDERGAPAAMDVALRMLIEGARPGQPRVLVLLGDGRDGPMYRLEECRTELRKVCLAKFDKSREIRQCVNERLDKFTIDSQQRFAKKLERWVSLAKAAGVRIYGVSNPNAEDFQRDRFQVLSWRTGGTARTAADENELVDAYSDLIDELNGQLVITFTDHDAVPGATRSYEVRVKGRSGTYSTPDYAVTFPAQPEGLAVKLADLRAMGEAKLGKKGLMALVIGVAVILALILLKLLLVLGKKIFGKGKKAAAGKAKKVKK